MRVVKSSRVSSANGRTIELVESFATPCYALKVIHSMCARAALRSPRTSTLRDDLFSYRSIKRLSPNYLAAWHHRRSVSEESSATLDMPSIRVDTLVCQTPHAMHALCVLCGSLVGQGAPISKSVCVFTQPWYGRLVSVCV